MSNHKTESGGISKGLLIFMFIVFLTIIWKFTDLFTSIVGTLLMIAVFAVDYNHRKGHIH
ncbi:MAG: hypothetical protein V4683_13055 [Bacteroidota bacterium]